MVSLHTFLDSLLLEYSPAHLLEVMQVECQPLITLLSQASQLSARYSVVEEHGTSYTLVTEAVEQKYDWGGWRERLRSS